MLRSTSSLFSRVNINAAEQLSDWKTCKSTLFFANRLVARDFSQLRSKTSNASSLNLFRASPSTLSVIMVKRCLSVQPVTKNLYLYTEEPRKIVVQPSTLKLTQDVDDKPLVVILAWLQAKQKYLSKYAQLYMDQGFDVLVAQITPWQLLWPVKGSQQVALDVVKFMASNEYYKKMVLHGFSVGGYMWGECLAQMEKDSARYQKVCERIVGQVFDSAADITEIPIGVPKALFPRNPRLQVALRNYMLYHMKTFHEAATQHYIRSSQLFHTNYVHAPALFILSKTDPVGAEASNRRVADSWIANGINLTWKCFDKSPHVGHYLKHREEYKQYLFDHLRSINMMKNPELLRAKL